MFDKNMNYLAASSRWTEDYGGGHGDLVGLNHYDVNPDMPERWRDVHRRAMAGEIFKNDDEYWVQSDGTRHWLRWAVMPWLDDDGTVGGVVIFAEEVTDRKLVEERLRQTKELDQIKSQFFANVSHELRTPLALVLGPVEKLLGDESVDRNVRTDLQVVERNARTLLGHVNDLLDVARLDAGRVKSDHVETDVATIVRFVSDHFSSLARDQAVDFIVDLPSALPAQTDSEKVRRIVFNLLSNAFKFTPNGGSVRISAREAPGQFIIEVADSGPGIPEASRAHVFERFRRLDSEGSGPAGTGLGLAIVREFTSLLGGSVSIDDAPEGGVQFTVELPSVAPAGKATASTSSPVSSVPRPSSVNDDRGPPPRAARTIRKNGAGSVLVVEDNPDMSNFIADGLAEDGFTVDVAFDGLRGYEMATEHPPDLVLTDIVLPAMRGDDLLQALRRNVALDSTPVIVLTARADEQLRIRLLREGAQDYLTKPFSFEELRTRVRNLVARKRAEEESKRLHAKERTERAWLQAVVDQMPDGVVLMDARGRVSMENRSALALAGPRPRDVDRFGNVRTLDLRRSSGERIPSDELPIARAIVRGETTVGHELVALRADGDLVPVLISAGPILTSDGMFVGAAMIVQDITMFKELERLREEWASIVAHDLQQPINSIVLRADLLLRGGITGQQAKDVRQIRTSAQRLSRMARDLTDASQLESRHLSLTLRRLDIGEWIREIVGRHPDAAARTRVRTPPDRRLFVRADAERFEQVIANLLSNALKHGTSDTEIRLDLEEVDGRAEVSVVHRGPGVSDEDLQSVFERYSRTRRARPSGTQGLGLGLYIAKGLVEAHGGHIWAESMPGELTRFAFNIPLDGPPLPASPWSSPPDGAKS